MTDRAALRIRGREQTGVECLLDGIGQFIGVMRPEADVGLSGWGYQVAVSKPRVYSSVRPMSRCHGIAVVESKTGGAAGTTDQCPVARRNGSASTIIARTMKAMDETSAVTATDASACQNASKGRAASGR